MPTALALLAVSLGLGAATFVLSFRRFAARFRRRGQGEHLADVAPPEALGLFALLLPRGPWAAWNLAVVVAATLVLATPHGLALRWVALDGADSAVWWLVSLPWWLLLTALPAWVCARHAARAAAPPSPAS